MKKLILIGVALFLGLLVMGISVLVETRGRVAVAADVAEFLE